MLFFGKIWMEPAVFAVEFRQWLGVADTNTEVWYLHCNGVLDILFFYTIMYYVGVERIVRYHALRDIFVTWVDRAGLQLEKKRKDSCYPSTLMIPAASGGDRQICTFLYLDFPITFDLVVMAPSRQEILGEGCVF